MIQRYSVYTRVGKSTPPTLVLLGDNYKSSNGGVSVAKKAIRKLMENDPCVRRKNVYIRKHTTNKMKLYRASSKKIKTKTVIVGNTTIEYTKKPSAKYLHGIDNYSIISS